MAVSENGRSSWTDPRLDDRFDSIRERHEATDDKIEALDKKVTTGLELLSQQNKEISSRLKDRWKDFVPIIVALITTVGIVLAAGH